MLGLVLGFVLRNILCYLPFGAVALLVMALQAPTRDDAEGVARAALSTPGSAG